MRKTILVTGSEGFIGKHLVRKLKSLDKYDVAGIDIKTGNDYLDLVVGNPHAIIHLANYKYDDNPIKLADDCMGMELMVKRLHPQTKFIYTSSSALYDEQHKVNPQTKYGLSKLIQERMLLSGSNPTILRLFNVYGEGADSGVIYEFQKRILNNESIILNGYGIPTRDFIHVSDVVDVIIEQIEVSDYPTILDVGTGIETSNHTLANMMYEILGKSPSIIYNDNPKGVWESVSHGKKYGTLSLRENLEKLLIKTEI